MLNTVSRGAPRKRIKDQLLRAAEISEKDWESRARERVSWEELVKRGSAAFETTRKEITKERRRKRKASAFGSPPAQGFPCPGCR